MGFSKWGLMVFSSGVMGVNGFFKRLKCFVKGINAVAGYGHLYVVP